MLAVLSRTPGIYHIHDLHLRSLCGSDQFSEAQRVSSSWANTRRPWRKPRRPSSWTAPGLEPWMALVLLGWWFFGIQFGTVEMIWDDMDLWMLMMILYNYLSMTIYEWIWSFNSSFVLRPFLVFLKVQVCLIFGWSPHFPPCIHRSVSALVHDLCLT